MKEQRQICAHSLVNNMSANISDKQAVLNAPEPTL